MELRNPVIVIIFLFILMPFLGYIMGKCITWGVLTAKKQFKETENGEKKEGRV